MSVPFRRSQFHAPLAAIAALSLALAAPASAQRVLWEKNPVKDHNPIPPQHSAPAEAPRNEAARTQARIAYLEGEVQRLRALVDEMAELLRKNLEAPRSDVPTRAEVEALRNEVARLRAENQQLQKTVGELPGKIAARLGSTPPPPPPARNPGTRSGPGSQPETMTGVEHTVSAGETLSDIARAYGVKMDVIVRANDLKDPGRLSIGQKLFIPQ